jgi:hypothetical protein
MYQVGTTALERMDLADFISHVSRESQEPAV